MSLVVHVGPSLGPLGDALADLLADPLEDPFAPEVIAVPTAGVRDWLQRRLAERLGVTANVEFVFPARFLAAALGQGEDDDDPWAVDRLTWAVLDVLASGTVGSVPGRPAARYATARRIADLFDGYATNRPSVIQQWVAGRDGDGTVDANDAVVPLGEQHRWQPELFRAVRASIGVPSRAERLTDMLAGLRAGRLEPALPARVAWFGVSSIAPGPLQVVAALAAARDVHLHLVHPSPAAWDACRFSLAGAVTPRASVDAIAGVGHPLLRSWARPAMEAAALVRGLDAKVIHTAPSPLPVPATSTSTGQLALDFAGAETPAASLLARIQHDLVDGVDAAHERVDPTDRTLQLHACHGATRQLEVLRDALGHLFAEDPTLQPHEVIVMCPDLDRFAPLAATVFARSILPIPVRVTDLTLGAHNAVWAALVDALGVISGRATTADVLALCGLGPIQHRFGIDVDDLDRYDRWTSDLGTTWGFDAQHRSEWLSLDDLSDGTWEATLDRVLLGAAMPAPTPRRCAGDVVPYDDVDAAAFASAGRLADLLARLRAARAATTGPRPVHEWCDALMSIVDSLFATAPDEDWQRTQVLDVIDDLRGHASAATTSIPLTIGDVRAMLNGVRSQPRGRLDLRSGSVTLTAMVPVRNLPVRVVCILGLEEGTLRAAGVDGDDVLAVRPCVGERDPRTEGRHLLLDAVLAAQEHFVVTFDGNDITTNRELPLPVHLQELVDVAVRSGARAEALIVRHPRRAHDERNFTGDGALSFDECMLTTALARREQPESPRILERTLETLVPDVVTLAELADACARPSRAYLRDRLDVRLPKSRENLDPNIPLAVTSLDQSALGRDLMRRESMGEPDAATTWRETTRLAGGLPPRALADAALRDVESEVASILRANARLRDLLTSATRSAEVDLVLDVAGRSVALRDTVSNISDTTVVRVAYERPKSRARIGAALALAALIVTRPEERWHAVLAMRGEKTGAKPVVRTLVPVDPDDPVGSARSFLATALDVRLRATREPLPLFEVSRDLDQRGSIEDEDLTRDMWDDGNAFLWGDLTADELLSIPPAADDPLVDVVPNGFAGPSRMAGYARYVWRAYDDFVFEGD